MTVPPISGAEDSLPGVGAPSAPGNDALESEIERLRDEIEEYAELTGRLTRLLTLTANGLKGEPADNVWHDWSDLPAIALQCTRKAFPVDGLPCPVCGLHAVIGVMLYTEEGNHQHTLYICTTWKAGAPSPCGWGGWTVPGWDA